MDVSVFHIIGWYTAQDHFKKRLGLFLDSVDHTDRTGVRLLASAPPGWEREGWEIVSLERDARSVGDPHKKPFIKDLLDHGNALAAPSDWLLYSNCDFGLAPDIYARLCQTSASAVEYMRREVDGDPDTLEELFSSSGELYGIGLDAFALRASLYTELRDMLPDFVVGEPHWDTAYSEILRRLVPVRRDTVSLFHPRHEPAWSIADPSPAGRHNEQLFVDALIEGKAPRHHIVPQHDRTDTAVIVASFGSSDERARAGIAGLRGQLRQDLYSDAYLVELLLPEEESRFPRDVLDRVRHVVVNGDESCLDLFQKEALLNLGWRTALSSQDYEFFIHVDADVYSQELDWFSRIRARLRDDPRRAVQGFHHVSDAQDPAFRRMSVGASFLLDRQTDLLPNPGICWGLHRDLLLQGDGLNPFCIDCGGDSAFVAEYLNHPGAVYDPWLYEFFWFHEIERELPFRAQLDCVPADLIHLNHGPATDRNYQAVRYAIDGFLPVRELVELCDDGLLRWREPACTEREILRLRPRMSSHEAVDGIFEQFAYRRRNGVRPRQRDQRERPVIDLRPRVTYPPAARERASDSERADRLAIFEPRQVFREEWPFSWCDNVVRSDGSTYLPIVAGSDPPALQLRREPGATSMVAALAVAPTWETRDFSRFTSLELTLLADTDARADISVWLTSRSTDGKDSESARYSLAADGVAAGERRRYAIALDRFEGADGFDLGRTRQVLLFASGCELLELSQVAVARDVIPGPAASIDRNRVCVSDGTVVGDDGERLRGVPVWVYKWGSINGFTEYSRDPDYYRRLPSLGVNAVRIVCFDAWQRSRGYPHYRFDASGKERTRFLSELDAVVEHAGAAGLYALVNYHDVGQLDLDHGEAFWRLVAPRYADARHVLYELANEPLWSPGDWTEEHVRAHRGLFELVRSHAPDTHVVLCSFANTVGGPQTMADVAVALDVDWSNASVGFHCYETDGTSDAIVAARASAPVLCTEVDVPTSYGGEPEVVAMDGHEWGTETLERLAVSWFAWRANGPEELERNFRNGFLADARRKGYAWA